jgi:hypothetical protein
MGVSRETSLADSAGCHNARVRDERLPVLWLCGPPGAGKSAAGWALHEGLARSGARAGFADIDQLGICLPAPPDDPQRYLLKEWNLFAVAGNFRAAGCDAVVVSGDLGPSPGISSGTIPGACLTICRLRVSPGELRRRLTSRGEGADFVAGALRQAQELDRTSFADACAGTDGLTIAEVARSAVGFEVCLRQLRTAGAAAYVDLDQTGFMSPVPADDPGGHRLKARNLADLWRAYHAAGARRLVLSGPVPDERAAAVYAGALPAARVTVCRLHAGPAELARRILRRGQGLSWPQPGDPLIGQPEARLRLVAAESAAEAGALERSGLGDLRIDTDGRTVAEVADLVARRW